jgi:hypothetical protein
VSHPATLPCERSDDALKAQLFPHEYDLIGNLRRFPLVVRYRLDVMKLHMSLGTWQQLDYQDRLQLAIAPFSTGAEQHALTELLHQSVLRVESRELQAAPLEPIADYQQRERVPEEIASALARFRLVITLEQWRALPELARFALAKLSRHGHDNRRLGPLIDDLLYTPGALGHARDDTT